MTDRWNNTLEINRVRSSDSRSWSMEEILSLMMVGLIICARILATHFFVLSKDTLEEISSLLRWWVMSLFFSIGNSFYFTEDSHSTWNPSWRRSSLQLGKKAEKGDRLSSSLTWILVKMVFDWEFQGGLSKPRHEDRALRTRATDAHFSCVLAHVTLAHHTPTLHRCLKDELSIRVCVSHSHPVFTCFIETCAVSLMLDWAANGIRQLCRDPWCSSQSHLTVMSPTARSRSAKRAHADQLRLRDWTPLHQWHWWRHYHLRCVWYHRNHWSRTVDFTTVNARARSKCGRFRCLCLPAGSSKEQPTAASILECGKSLENVQFGI